MMPDATPDVNDEERLRMRHLARIAAKANKLIRIEKAKIDAMFPPGRAEYLFQGCCRQWR